MLYGYLLNLEKEALPFGPQTAKASVAIFVLKHLFGKRYWRDVVYRQAEVHSNFIKCLKELGVNKDVLIAASNRALHHNFVNF